MSEPADITPEDRDWTYVITEGCEECAFRPQPPETTGARLLVTVPLWQEALAAPSAEVHPSPPVRRTPVPARSTFVVFRGWPKTTKVNLAPG